MKHMNILKKLGAMVTAVAMIGTLGMSALAANTSDTDTWEKDFEVEQALDITAVSAGYVPVENPEGAYKDYTITIKYTCAQNAQVTILGYVYEGEGIPETAPETVADTAKIYAVDQQAAGGGVAKIKLTSNPNAEKAITGNELLVIKMGTDDATYSAAQAVMVNLANAEEIEEPVEIESVIPVNDIYVPYGTATAGLLPETVEVIGTQGGNQVTKDATVDWNTEGLAETVTDTIEVTGTVQVDGIKFTNDDEDDLTVTANIKWNSLGKDVAIANPVSVRVPVGTPVAEIEALVKQASVGLKLAEDGEVVEAVSLADAVISEITYTGAEEVGATATAKATLAFAGVEGESIFVLIDYEVEVTLNVVEAGIAGDMNGDEKVNTDDVIYLLRHTLLGSGMYPLSGDGNVDSIGGVNTDDVIYLLRHTLLGSGMYPLYPEI